MPGVFKENSLLIDHNLLRHSLDQRHFGPPTPRHLSKESFEGRQRKPKGTVDRNRRKFTGEDKAAAKPSTVAALGVSGIDATAGLDFSISKSSVCVPWARATASGRRGTGLGMAELQTDVILRAAVRDQIKGRRDLTWAQARPLLVEYIRDHEPPTREEVEDALEHDPDINVQELTGAQANSLMRRLFKRYDGRLEDCRAYLMRRYKEDPLPPSRWQKEEPLPLVAETKEERKTRMEQKRAKKTIDRRLSELQIYSRALARNTNTNPAKVGVFVPELKGNARATVPLGEAFSTYAPSKRTAGKTIPTKRAIADRVDRTLSGVHESYFPPSRRMAMREDAPLEPSRMQYVPKGSGVVFTGQGISWRNRHNNEALQISLLNRHCVLGMDEINEIKLMLSSLTEDANPSISFKRFLRLMKAIGVGGSDVEVEFFMRLYKTFDEDGNGKVEFEELIDGLAVLAGGSARQKLQMYYEMFSHSEQIEGEGDALYGDEHDNLETKSADKGLRRYHVQRMMLTLIQHLDHADDGTVAFTSSQFNHIFQSLDTDSDGVISFEELYDHVASHAALAKFIANSSVAFTLGGGEKEGGKMSEATFKDVLLGDEEPSSPKGSPQQQPQGGHDSGGVSGGSAPSPIPGQEAGGDGGGGGDWWRADGGEDEPAARPWSSGTAGSTVISESASDASLYERRYRARHAAKAKRRFIPPTGGSYRSQGVTGYLGLAAKSGLFASNESFDESVLRKELGERVARERPPPSRSFGSIGMNSSGTR